MGLARFHFYAVIPDGKRSFVLSDEPDASMSEELAGDIFFLHDQTERGLVADCPYLWFVERAGGGEEDDDEDDEEEEEEEEDDEEDDEDDDDEDVDDEDVEEDEEEEDEDVEKFSGGDDPVEILELLDELERALAKHASTPPVYTMFHWTNPDGTRGGSTVVLGTLDGVECRLYGGWDGPSLNFFVKPPRKSRPITGDRITLETHRGGPPEIEVHRTTLADYYRTHIAEMKAVCRYAIANKGLVRSSFVL